MGDGVDRGVGSRRRRGGGGNGAGGGDGASGVAFVALEVRGDERFSQLRLASRPRGTSGAGRESAVERRRRVQNRRYRRSGEDPAYAPPVRENTKWLDLGGGAAGRLHIDIGRYYKIMQVRFKPGALKGMVKLPGESLMISTSRGAKGSISEHIKSQFSTPTKSIW